MLSGWELEYENTMRLNFPVTPSKVILKPSEKRNLPSVNLLYPSASYETPFTLTEALPSASFTVSGFFSSVTVPVVSAGSVSVMSDGVSAAVVSVSGLPQAYSWAAVTRASRAAAAFLNLFIYHTSSAAYTASDHSITHVRARVNLIM